MPVEDLVTPGDDRIDDAVVLGRFACGVEVGEPVQGLQGAGPVVGEVDAVELLECVPSGFEPREGVEEPVEAGLFVGVEGVGSFEQQKPGPEQFGVEGTNNLLQVLSRVVHGFTNTDNSATRELLAT